MDVKVQERIDAFNQIRDEPFHLPTSLEDMNSYCYPKHERLKIILEKLGYETNYGICKFKWSEQILPKEVLNIKHEDVDTHIYLNSLIDEKEIFLDCTFDSGFLKSNNWDGKNSTQIAINYFEIIPPELLEKTKEFLEKNYKSLVGKNFEFYLEANKYFDNIRERKRKIIERMQRSGGKNFVGSVEDITNKIIQIGEKTSFGRGLLKKIVDKV